MKSQRQTGQREAALFGKDGGGMEQIEKEGMEGCQLFWRT